MIHIFLSKHTVQQPRNYRLDYKVIRGQSSGWNPFRYDSMQIQKKKLETINYYYGHNKSLSYCKNYSFLIFSYVQKNKLFILLLVLVRKVLMSGPSYVLQQLPVNIFLMSSNWILPFPPTDLTEVSFVFFNILFPNVFPLKCVTLTIK